MALLGGGSALQYFCSRGLCKPHECGAAGGGAFVDAGVGEDAGEHRADLLPQHVVDVLLGERPADAV